MTSSPQNPENNRVSAELRAFATNLHSAITELQDHGKLAPIILIDGPAAAGKSSLAKMVQDALFRLGDGAPRVVHMDDLYPGWDGLAAGAEYLVRKILVPVKAGELASWQVYNWEQGRRDAWREFAGGTPLIVEGCGSISAASAELADIRVWVDAPEETRLERWIGREGNDEHWAGWRAQELDFYAREKSQALADTAWRFKEN